MLILSAAQGFKRMSFIALMVIFAGLDFTNFFLLAFAGGATAVTASLRCR
jgi:hypothetical protein